METSKVESQEIAINFNFQTALLNKAWQNG
jgi:hypothetical protein